MKKTQQQLLQEEQERRARILELSRKNREEVEKKRIEKLLAQSTKQMQRIPQQPKIVEIDPNLPVKYAFLVSHNKTNILRDMLCNYSEYVCTNVKEYVNEQIFKTSIVNYIDKKLANMKDSDSLFVYIDNEKINNFKVVEENEVEYLTPNDLPNDSRLTIISNLEFNHPNTKLSTHQVPLQKFIKSNHTIVEKNNQEKKEEKNKNEETREKNKTRSKSQKMTWGKAYMVIDHFSVEFVKHRPVKYQEYASKIYDL